MAREPIAPTGTPGGPPVAPAPEPEPAPPRKRKPIEGRPPGIEPGKPPPPTFEPAPPQPYIEPKDAKVVSTDAKGNPAVLQTPDGKKHYTPFQTTMWGELGFATEDEYRKSQRTGQPSQYVGITKGIDKPVRVLRADLAKTSQLKGEEQFEALMKMGVIPFGSKFLPGPGGFKGSDWSYIDPKTIKKYKGQLLARLARASTKKPRVVIPPEMRVDIGERPPVTPTGVPGGPPMPPVPIEVKHPAYLKGREAFRELQDAAKKPTLENIQEIIDEWKKAQEWWAAYQDLHPATIKAGFKREFEGTAGKEYMGKLETYNSQVIAYNLHIENFDKIAADLEKEGAALGVDKVTKYNDEMVRLNALTLSWEREAAGINLENEAAVRLHNQKLANIRRDYAKLVGRVGVINATLQNVNAFNAKIDKFNANLAKLVDPGEPPAEYLKTAGNIGAAIYEGIKTEYKKAVNIEGTLTQKIGNVGLLTAELIVPGVWVPSPYFGIDIKERGKGDIALNVGLDLFVLLPVARTATIFIRQALGATAKGAIKLAVRAEAKLAKDAVWAMRKAYGREAANALKAVSKLQATYIKRLARLEFLKAAGKPTTRQLKATLKTENQLRTSSNNFVNAVYEAQTRLGKKGVVGAGFDSPEIAMAFSRMPEELIRHTKGVLQAIAKSRIKPKSIKQLKADVAKAEATLKAAKAKDPFSADKWVDLVMELLEKQVILSQRQSGGLAKIHQRLISTQQQLSRVRAQMKAPLKPLRPTLARKLTAKQRLAHRQAQRLALKQTELALERQLLDLTQQLAAGLRKMEIEWGRGGVIMGGGGRRTATATAVRPRTAPTSVSATVAAPTTATMTAWQAAAMTATAAITAAVVKAVGKPIPEVAAVVKGLTDVEIIKAVEVATIKAVEAAHKLALKPTTKTGIAARQALAVEIAQSTKLAMQTAIRAAPSAKAAEALKTALKPITKAAVKVGLKTARLLKPLIPKLKILLRPPPPVKTDKEKRKVIRKAKGAIAWRHGELRGKDVFHVGLYPYTRQKDYLTVVGKKPAGATIVKGPGSARQSIRLLYGKSPPRKVRGDIGFFDFHITPTGPKRVDIDFKPDPKLETTGDITIGKKTPPITERRTGLGRGKSPRITPKTPRLRR